MAVKTVFIGGGNITKAIVEGMLYNHYPADFIYVVDRNLSKRDFFAHTLGVKVATDISTAALLADVIVLAVKPQQAIDVCAALKTALIQHDPVILSVMTGMTTTTLNQLLGIQVAIVRAMPNTPSKIRMGATGLFANSRTNAAQKQYIETIMKSIGIIAWLAEEEQLTAINALSGSGPAYYFYFMELMQALGETLGLPADIAKTFMLQTAVGAAKLALESQESLPALRAQVTSKGGTTEAAIKVMQEKDLAGIFKAALEACYHRAIELGKIE